MPVWVYWSASAYLLFISITGLFMNIVVVIIILSDSQVIVEFREFSKIITQLPLSVVMYK
jgi:hypothetical protein